MSDARPPTVVVAWLRGINVGGAGRLTMADLREAAGVAGFRHVRTVIQSGNVVGAVDDVAGAGDRLRAAVRASTDLDPAVVVTTHAELTEVVAHDPFIAAGADPKRVHVVFSPTPPDLGGFDATPFAPEEVAVVGSTVRLHVPGGLGRSPLATALTRRGGPDVAAGTMRGWPTVLAVLRAADDVAAELRRRMTRYGW